MATVIERLQLKYEIRFLSPFHFGTGMRNGLVHRGVSRDPEGMLYIPGSTLKGVVRERCEQLAKIFDLEVTEPHGESLAPLNPKPNIIARIFGSHLQGGLVYFDDAKLDEAQREWFTYDPKTYDPEEGVGQDRVKAERFLAWQTEKRTQVSLSRLTGTAEGQRLYNSEYGISQLSFAGEIKGLLEGYPMDDGPGTYSLLLLAAGLQSLDLDAIGGNKSTGLGNLSLQISALSINGEAVDMAVLLDHLEELEYYAIAREEG